MFFFPFSSLSLSLPFIFSKVARPVKFLLSPPLTPSREFQTVNFSRTFDYRRLLRGSHRGHLQKSVHAHHALITGIEPFTRSRSTFPRGIFPNRYCPLRFSPLSAPSSISLSLSLPRFFPRPRGMRTKETKEESFHRHHRLCMRAEQTDARKGGEEHRFSAGGSAFASKRLTSATLQPRPIYTTIDREKPVNRKLVKFDP